MIQHYLQAQKKIKVLKYLNFLNKKKVFFKEKKKGGAQILPKTYKEQVKETKKILKVG